MLAILLICLALSLLVHVPVLSIVLAWRDPVCDAPIVPSTPAPLALALAPAPAPLVSPRLAARDPCPSPPPAPSTPVRPAPPPEVGPLTPPTSPPSKKRTLVKRAPAPLSSKELENRHCEFALGGRFGPAGCRCRRGLVIRRRRLLRESRVRRLLSSDRAHRPQDELWDSRQELGGCLAELFAESWSVCCSRAPH